MLAYMKKALVLVAAATSAGLVTGVHSFSLSQECQQSLEGVLTSPDAACLNPASLLSSFLGNDSGSVISLVDTWLTGVCSAGSCSNQSIANVVTNITSGCTTELQEFGINVNSIQSEAISIAQDLYPTIRDIACLQNDTTNQLCAISTLTSLENVIGQVNASDLSFVNLFLDAKSLFAGGIQSIACTDCAKESFSIAMMNFPSYVSYAQPEAEALCGASFVDGEQPSDVTQTANSAAFSSTTDATTNSAGFRVSALGPSVVFIGIVSAAFSILV